MTASPNEGVAALYVTERSGSRVELRGDAVIATLGDGRALRIAPRSVTDQPGSVLVRSEFVPEDAPPSLATAARDTFGALQLRPT